MTIKKILFLYQGIEGAAETLEQLWISYNQIDRLKPIRSLQRLKVLYMSHNYVREWREFEHLSELPCMEDLVFLGNPLEEESITQQKYTEEVIKRLLILKKLDGFPVIREVDNDDAEEVSSTLDMEEIDRLAKYIYFLIDTKLYYNRISIDTYNINEMARFWFFPYI